MSAAQQTVKEMWKDQYQEKIKWYRDLILHTNSKYKTKTTKSVLAICSTDTFKENPYAILMFNAAAIDIITSYEKKSKK